MAKEYKFETLQLHVGQENADSATDSRAVPIYATSSYVFKDCKQAQDRFGLAESGNIYTRLMNPTSDILEQRIAALEGGVGALVTASGAAAITYAIMNIAKQGDNIVSAKNLYGGTYNLFANVLSDYGITTTWVDVDDIEGFKQAVKDNTKAIYVETMGNPNSTVADIETLAQIAHGFGIPLIVDNTFATPFLVRPIEYGADIVVHSATKFLGGHGTVLGGIVVDGGNFDWEQNDKFPGLTMPNPNYHGVVYSKACGNSAYIMKLRTTLMRDMGATISPFNSFLILQGVETLSLRVERHVFNALKVVEYLKNHPKVDKVNHPAIEDRADNELYKKYFPNGGGSIFTFEIKGGEEEAKSFIDNLKIFSLLANVADVKSLVIHPASTTHSQMSEDELIETGIKANTIRLSIGTENIDDIIWDMEQAFECI